MSGVWPGPLEEQVLTACFAPEPEARAALDLLPPGKADYPAIAMLGPLLYRRWPSSDHAAVVAGSRAYLSLWRQNQERLDHLSAVVSALAGRGIECLLLKGAAMALRYYRDPGVRGMRDFDLLIAERDLEPAIVQLQQSGWVAEGGCTAVEVLRRARVVHAWQFSLGSGQSCDLHWRPVVRCYSPEVTRLFWHGAERVQLGNSAVAVPSPTEQLFHVCVHGLQWDWHPQLRWIADAITVLREPIDWDRLRALAAAAHMQVRLARALEYVRLRFPTAIPAEVPTALEAAAPQWEHREYQLLLKPCPLGYLDSAWWHIYHFRRIRPHDPAWSAMPQMLGFPHYLRAFLNAGGLRELWNKLRPELAVRRGRRGAGFNPQPDFSPACRQWHAPGAEAQVGKRGVHTRPGPG
jgi:hypothetical protein